MTFKKITRLPICMLADSLYAAKPIIDICKKYSWNYLIRFKDRSIPTLAQEFDSIINFINDSENKFGEMKLG